MELLYNILNLIFLYPYESFAVIAGGYLLLFEILPNATMTLYSPHRRDRSQYPSADSLEWLWEPSGAEQEWERSRELDLCKTPYDEWYYE